MYQRDEHQRKDKSDDRQNQSCAGETTSSILDILVAGKLDRREAERRSPHHDPSNAAEA